MSSARRQKLWFSPAPQVLVAQYRHRALRDAAACSSWPDPISKLASEGLLPAHPFDVLMASESWLQQQPHKWMQALRNLQAWLDSANPLCPSALPHYTGMQCKLLPGTLSADIDIELDP